MTLKGGISYPFLYVLGEGGIFIKRIGRLGIVFALLFTILIATGCSKEVEKNNIHLATGGTGGTYFAYGNALKDAAKAHIDLESRATTGAAILRP